MEKIIVTLISLFLLGACQEPSSSKQNENSQQNISISNIHETVSKEVFTKKMEEKTNKILIDIRTPEEYQKGTIEKALNINFYDEKFEEKISELDKAKPIFIFCQSGGRSGKALEQMKGLEFKEVYDLQGGYGGWKN